MLGSSSGSRTTELARRDRQGKARRQLCRRKADPAEVERAGALPHASEVHQNTPNRWQEEDTDTRPSALKHLRENERELIRNEPRMLGGSGEEGVWCCYGREGDGARSWPSERGKQEAKQVKQAARQRGGVSESLSEPK
ncbi:hypothetical protein NDU88_004572 [Pleurodeles waltl]|uniref:Uncharacterized protein n=1 Tax=Pleurodeles waltl TaxID=8319 RepID=A0AAV7M6N8_PLEWA|nr:hypothetical protein NDU88_004572 [Pleurodeles waltl]